VVDLVFKQKVAVTWSARQVTKKTVGAGYVLVRLGWAITFVYETSNLALSLFIRAIRQTQKPGVTGVRLKTKGLQRERAWEPNRSGIHSTFTPIITPPVNN
jgi:hypothetical protein